MKRNKPLRRKKPLRRCSKSHAKALSEYRVRRVAYLTVNNECKMYMFPAPAGVLENCLGRATQIHHKKRRGKNLNNEETWMPICNSCHVWIHEHQSEARKLGCLY